MFRLASICLAFSVKMNDLFKFRWIHSKWKGNRKTVSCYSNLNINLNRYLNQFHLSNSLRQKHSCARSKIIFDQFYFNWIDINSIRFFFCSISYIFEQAITRVKYDIKCLKTQVFTFWYFENKAIVFELSSKWKRLEIFDIHSVYETLKS